jgi:hypothetical protein
MPTGDLDDFELERTPSPSHELGPSTEAGGPTPGAAEETDSPLPGPAIEGSRLLPMTLAALAVVAFGVLVVLFLVFRQPTATRPTTLTAAPATASAPSPAPSAAQPVPTPGPLPALDQSDEYVRSAAQALSAHPELARWLSQAALVRTLAAVVTNIADGETPRPHLEFLAPRQRFRAAPGRGRQLVPDPAGFAGYDRFADAIASIDAGAAVSVFHTLEPLFDAAYRELGHPGGRFRAGVDTALAALVDAPVPPADTPLVPHALGFRYADPRLEALSAAQKQLLRTGPRNVAIIQAKLREVQAALAATEAHPAEPAP